MWRKLGSTGQKSATNYLSGTTFILTNDTYAAIDTAYEAARTFANAKSEANRHKRLAHYDTAHRTCEQAIALYDHLALLLHLLREALHVCSPHGRLRTQAQVRSELLQLFDMIEALDCAAMRTALQPIRTHLDDILVPFKHAEAIEAELRAMVPPDALDFLVLAWHHDHFVHQSKAKQKHSHQRERDFWLACAAGLLGDTFAPLQALVIAKLDSIVRASSLSEMVNGLIRPYLNSCKGQITQATLNLIMFSQNHRRYKSGKRQGKAPIELLTGEPLAMPWWELLRRQLTPAQGGTAPDTMPGRPPLHLVPNPDGGAAQQTRASDHAILSSPGASEAASQPKDSQAA